MLPAAAVVIAAAGCAPEAPDYQSIWSTTADHDHDDRAPKLPNRSSAYLENLGVTGAPVAPDKLTDLTVSLPTPPGWAPYTNPNLAPGTRVIAKGDTYPTAMLLVFQLDGDFDVKRGAQARRRRRRAVGELQASSTAPTTTSAASRRR